ncbi:MAG: hypothetical protein WDN76_09645 [Alphaproteobacteria bacterium]
MKGVKLSLNVTNLTDKRYASNFDNSVFQPSDSGVVANGDNNAIAGDPSGVPRLGAASDIRYDRLCLLSICALR